MQDLGIRLCLCVMWLLVYCCHDRLAIDDLSAQYCCLMPGLIKCNGDGAVWCGDCIVYWPILGDANNGYRAMVCGHPACVAWVASILAELCECRDYDIGDCLLGERQWCGLIWGAHHDCPHEQDDVPCVTVERSLKCEIKYGVVPQHLDLESHELEELSVGCMVFCRPGLYESHDSRELLSRGHAIGREQKYVCSGASWHEADQ